MDLSERGLEGVPDDIPTNVYTLKLYGNKIKKIENLENLTITSLYMDSNEIEKIEGLPDTLKELYLGNNKITKIENLPKNLYGLALHNNPLTRFENIPRSVRSIFMYQTKVEYVDPKLYDHEIADEICKLMDTTPDRLRLSYYFQLGYAAIRIQRWWRKVLNNRGFKTIEKQIEDEEYDLSITI